MAKKKQPKPAPPPIARPRRARLADAIEDARNDAADIRKAVQEADSALENLEICEADSDAIANLQDAEGSLLEALREVRAKLAEIQASATYECRACGGNGRLPSDPDRACSYCRGESGSEEQEIAQRILQGRDGFEVRGNEEALTIAPIGSEGGVTIGSREAARTLARTLNTWAK